MFKYIINISLLFVFAFGFSQEQETKTTPIEKDSIFYKTAYGLRLGVDISKPIKAQIDGSFSGFEIVVDYRISNRFYVAAELGNEEETTQEDFSNSTSKGQYIRLGFNYNAYENWLDMNNEIFTGFRYGFSVFDQTLNNYTPNVNSLYFPSENIISPITDTGLTAHWTEFMLGIKVETFKNLFLSASVSYKIMLSVEDQENFKTLFSPGFNRIFETGTGFGFNYTISYLIPFAKK